MPKGNVNIATSSIRKLFYYYYYGAPPQKVPEDILLIQIKLLSAQCLHMNLEGNLSSSTDVQMFPKNQFYDIFISLASRTMTENNRD